MRPLNKRIISGLTALTIIASGAGSLTVGDAGLNLDIFATAADVVASGFCGRQENNNGEDVTWKVDSEGTLTISGTGAMADYSDGFFSNSAPWSNETFTKVVIEPGITSVGTYSFSYLSAIESVTLPEGLTFIGARAFYMCSGLTTINIPESVHYFDSQAFVETPWLTAQRENDPLVIFNNVLVDGNTASGEVHIPEGITSIAPYAFDCRPDYDDGSNVYIPSTVTEIYCTIDVQTGAPLRYECFFDWDSLKGIYVDEENPNYSSEDGVLYNKDKTELLRYPDARGVVKIRDSVTSIFAHSLCRGTMTDVILPCNDEEITIYRYAFQECGLLNSLTIPRNVTYIYPYAFVFPDMNPSFTIRCYSGSYAEQYAKDYGYNYEIIDDNANVLVDGGRCGDDCYWKLDSEGTVTISGTGEMYDYNYDRPSPWENDQNVKKVVIESGVTSIGDWAFDSCKNLASVTIPEGVTYIGDRAFFNCYALTNVVLPSTLRVIGWAAFDNCTSLTEMEFPAALQSIGDNAFYGCESLEEFRVAEGNQEYCSVNGLLYTADKKEVLLCPCGKTEAVLIDGTETSTRSTFLDCKKLRTVTIPASVTDLGNSPFYTCESLESITVAEDNTHYSTENGILYNKDKTTLICCPCAKTAAEIHAGTQIIAKDAFNLCTNLTAITVPEGVTEIGSDAFNECRKLAEVKLPKSLKTIGSGAFSLCYAMYDIELPEGLETIGNSAFTGTNISVMTIPKSVTTIGNYAMGYYWGTKNNLKIRCYKDTAGEKYAVDNGFEYELITDPSMKIDLKFKLKEGEEAPDVTKLTATAYGADSTAVKTVKAAADGSIDLSELPAGDYTVELALEGFAPRKIEFTAGGTLGDVKLCRYGDVTGDGSINTEDIARVQQKISKWNVKYVYDETGYLDGDKDSDTEDLAKLQQFVSGWNVKLGKKA